MLKRISAASCMTHSCSLEGVLPIARLALASSRLWVDRHDPGTEPPVAHRACRELGRVAGANSTIERR